MPRRILVVGSKGGSSRTTTTVLLATAIAKFAERTVGIVDLDPQGSAHNWIKTFPIVNVEASDASGKQDYLITDTQPLVEPSEDMVTAARKADLILLLCSDSPLDVHASTLTVKNLLKTKALKRKTHILFSRVVNGTGLSQQLDTNADILGVQRLKTVLHFRNCYRLAPIKGWKALNATARQEVQKLTIEVLALLNS
jgi:cellulose biosynthesis protein BcsQ|tara:strand:+ start:44 stop:634 length:591 start_codon:yes stop_codon:yes gene_type:complete